MGRARFTSGDIIFLDIFLESFLSLALPKEGVLSPSTAAFLLGVSRLSALRPSGPGESQRVKVFESSFGDIFQPRGVPELARLP